jgi:homoserine dehydrogenase
MEGLTRGESLSGIVREAHRRGFTEPDPREDLGGMDVARKALILSRCLGWGGEMTHVQVSSLVPEALRTLDQEAFWSRLEELDHQSFPRVEPGNVLRYLASIEPGKIEVGVTSVPLHSLWGNLRGTDNLIAIHSRRYGENPLVIQGAGAGTELTAAGILHDLLEVAR